MKKAQTYVDFRMEEWGMAEQSSQIQNIVRRVLGELHPEALLMLKDTRLEVMILPEAEYSAWVYFPVSASRFLTYKSKFIERWKQPMRLTRAGNVIYSSPVEYVPDRERPKVDSMTKAVFATFPSLGNAGVTLKASQWMDEEYAKAHATCAVFWRRLISNNLCPKKGTRVMLVMSTAGFAKESPEVIEDYLRQDLGHVLLFLRSRTARNEYSDAMNEWRYSTLTGSLSGARMPRLKERTNMLHGQPRVGART